jgi:capsule polysaccharide export protein KpsE/RkpR
MSAKEPILKQSLQDQYIKLDRIGAYIRKAEARVGQLQDQIESVREQREKEQSKLLGGMGVSTSSLSKKI